MNLREEIKKEAKTQQEVETLGYNERDFSKYINSDESFIDTCKRATYEKRWIPLDWVLIRLDKTTQQDEQKFNRLRQWILGLYETADHLNHEDERNSCARILKEIFNAETEEGTFGELFLTDKSKKDLAVLGQPQKEVKK